MSNEHKLKEHLSTLNSVELAEFLKTTVMGFRSLTKQYAKALDSKFNSSFYCSRAKATTLNANVSKIGRVLSSTIDDLKVIIAFL
ncbi:MAG: hypothetical protein COA58_04045 [Bacteroidetes bacterium]|nr:MAG: hypothetical protein COA58_04045 [Bacteroidota bacterium]